jgi:hypothetical protein
MISKVINSNLYEQEMKWMIDTAIEKLKKNIQALSYIRQVSGLMLKLVQAQ